VLATWEYACGPPMVYGEEEDGVWWKKIRDRLKGHDNRPR
jgi:hypothetical protein